jgi:photosystem II stability/assembly factor-like uncharacterized protein
MLSNEGLSKWKKLLTVPSKQVRTVYFIDQMGDPKIGFVSFGDEVWRTTDGGAIWVKCFGQYTEVNDFAFKDSVIGWCANYGQDIGCYKTIDGGLSWQALNSPIGGQGIYYNQSNNRLFLTSWAQVPAYSVDEGATWKYFPEFSSNTQSHNHITFLNSLDGIISSGPREDHPFYRTNDGGITWYPTSFLQECWQPLAIKGTDTYFAACEVNGNGVNRSDDKGQSWTNIDKGLQKYQLIPTGDIRGNQCRLYLQSEVGLKNGIFRSLDNGETWEYIGGPQNLVDRRFFVKDRHVFAGDTFGNLWYLYDTLGFKSEVRVNLSSDLVNFDSVAECLDSRQVLYITNPYSCDSIKISNINWLNSSPSFTLGTTGSLPRYLAPEQEDSLEINFIRQGTGTFGAKVKITLEFSGYTKDTIITITGTRVKASKASLTSSRLNFDTITTCQTKELTSSIINNGCDTVQVSIDYTPPFDFTLTTPSSSFTLAPGSSNSIKVNFASKTAGTKSDLVYFRVRPKVGTEYLVGLIVEGVVRKELSRPSLYPTTLDFDTLSVCDTTTRLLAAYVRNLNPCDSITILSATISGDPDFSLVQNISLPATIGPDSQLVLSTLFSTVTKGPHIAQCTFRVKNDTSVFDTIINLSGFGKSGKGVLAASPYSIDFGTTTLCEERDSIVTLRNTGCDTLRVSAIDVQGLGFSSTVTTPIVIPPSQSITIPVTTVVDTSEGNISTGTITFSSDADNQIAPITLSRGYTYPKSYSFHIGMLDGTATSDEIVRLAIVGEQGLGSAGSGVKRLDFDLSLNEDLLEYIRPEGSNSVTKNGSHITISHANELTSINDTLAILVYHVFLTKDSATDITVSNISINNGDTSACAPKIAAATQAGFTYRYECGDRHIQSFLRTGQASSEITSIRPNPAKDELTVEFMQNERSSVSFEVYDMLWTLIVKKEGEYDTGHKKKTIELRDLPSGSYVISLRSVNGVSSKRFTKEK